jgi:hypothetical protein
MKIIVARMLTVALTLLLAACEQPGYPHHGTYGAYGAPTSRDAAATLTTDATVYPPAAPVTVRLANRSGAPFGYNLCRAILERNIDDDWRQAQATLGERCTAELRTLRPGQVAAFSFRLDRELRRGQYRVRLAEPIQGDRDLTVSNNFRLEGNDSD